MVHVKKIFAPLLFLAALLGVWAFACGRYSPATLPDASVSPPHLFGAGPNPSPACLVSDNGGAYTAAAPNGINVSANDPVSIQLASYAGVRSWSLTVFGLDEVTLSSPPVLTYSIGPPATYSFTYPNSTGRAVLLQSVVNGGVNVNGVKQSSYVTTIGVFSLTAAGQRVLATGETIETCPAGWVCDWNAQVRALNTGVVGGIYTTTLGVTALTSNATSYQLGFDTVFSTAKNTTPNAGTGVTVLIASPVVVSADVSFNTGSSSSVSTVTTDICTPVVFSRLAQ